MALKNYTSTVPVARSISYIEQKLVQHQAKQILKLYTPDHAVKSLCFTVSVRGNDVHFQLPAKVVACESILLKNLSRRAKPETKNKIKEQAERTAWKILSDWVEAQMAMIELAQVDFLEVFMPYVFDPVKQMTLYEIAQESGFKRLLEGGHY